MKKLIAAIAGLSVAAFATMAVGAQSSPAPGEAALGGYCPVAYAMMNKAMKGDPQYASEHDGKTYLLSNDEAKQMFDGSPEKYLPAYEGWCATAVAQGMKLESDPTLFTVYNGRTYLFSKADAKAMFDKDQAGTVAKADANWPKLADQASQ
ncbi:MAG: YHS domain protein [Luteitalea sp.]|nr:YHS domain protein [Luteitalea sp.]